MILPPQSPPVSRTPLGCWVNRPIPWAWVDGRWQRNLPRWVWATRGEMTQAELDALDRSNAGIQHVGGC